VDVKRIDGLAYREATPSASNGDESVVLLIHGFPESSYMWREVMSAVAESGWRALALDMPCMGDSDTDLPGTWERQVDAIERFRSALGLERVALVMHDWGGLSGMRWACDHPDAVSAMVISSSGFFADGKWHGMAKAMRTRGDGEKLVEGMEREGFGGLLTSLSSGFDAAAIDECWKAFADSDRRQATLDFYRSCDFEKLEPYDGKLAALGVPTLILWGEDDAFAPLAGGKRFERELPDARLVVFEGAGHFVVDDEPQRYGKEVADFLAAEVAQPERS